MIVLKSLPEGEGIANLSDFCNPPNLVLNKEKGTRERKVVVYDLPVLVVNTPLGVEINSKEVRTEGCSVKLFDTDGQLRKNGVTYFLSGRTVSLNRDCREMLKPS